MFGAIDLSALSVGGGVQALSGTFPSMGDIQLSARTKSEPIAYLSCELRTRSLAGGKASAITASVCSVSCSTAESRIARQLCWYLGELTSPNSQVFKL